jgi:hypothetical protein
MIYLLKKIVFYGFPLLLYLLIVVYIDPYDVYKKTDTESMNKYEEIISEKINYRLYNLTRFRNNPCGNIILGDSRSDILDERIFTKLEGERHVNMSYGGGTIKESYTTFMYVKDKVQLKNVYWGINVDRMDLNCDVEFVSNAMDVMESPLMYYFSTACLKATFYILLEQLNIKDFSNYEKPNVDAANFWREQLANADYTFENFKLDKDNFELIREVADYCENNDIRLILFSPPTHISLQSKYRIRIPRTEKEILNNFGNISFYINLDSYNQFTKDSLNFSDPLHIHHEKASGIVQNLVKAERNVLLK